MVLLGQCVTGKMLSSCLCLKFLVALNFGFFRLSERFPCFCVCRACCPLFHFCYPFFVCLPPDRSRLQLVLPCLPLLCIPLLLPCRVRLGVSLLYLHGRQKQQRRLDTFEEFVSRTSPCCLITTDLAARGIDFVVQQAGPRGGPEGGLERLEDGLSAVDLVVQFDCPDSAETHVHRVGRTARFTRKGHALLLLLPSETAFVRQLKARGVR